MDAAVQADHVATEAASFPYMLKFAMVCIIIGLETTIYKKNIKHTWCTGLDGLQPSKHREANNFLLFTTQIGF